MEYRVLAYYVFVPMDQPELEMRRHKEFLQNLDGRARIYISAEGINAQLSLHKDHVQKYVDFVFADERLREAEIKCHEWEEHAFAKLTVKVRKELVAVDRKIDLTQRGEYLSPEEWRKKLDHRDEGMIVLDVRNRYESEVGHFAGAVCPPVETFRDFPEYARQLAQSVDTKNTPVMMYCTGGIRCELYSALLKEEGFTTVYQLKGGVIQYGLQEGNEHWHGKLFVFDDRMVVPISEERAEIISTCQFCAEKSDTYYNCANMDCNALFLSCPTCVQDRKGCCNTTCLEAERVRAFIPATHPKPFRKLLKTIKSV